MTTWPEAAPPLCATGQRSAAKSASVWRWPLKSASGGPSLPLPSRERAGVRVSPPRKMRTFGTAGFFKGFEVSPSFLERIKNFAADVLEMRVRVRVAEPGPRPLGIAA